VYYAYTLHPSFVYFIHLSRTSMHALAVGKLFKKKSVTTNDLWWERKSEGILGMYSTTFFILLMGLWSWISK